MNIADIFASVRLNLETGEFETQAVAATDKAVETMGQRMKAAAGAALGTGFGIAVGAAFGAAAAGAIELDAAVRQLRATTGLTGKEAVAAGKSLAAMAKTNLASFDEIGAVMAKVRIDLGLTGEEADKVTQQFLTFATATGQTAADAVLKFDDILDSYNLTADEALGIMDKLVASTQTYGGNVPELQAQLGTLSPTFQAMGLDIDHALGFLNLFNAAGLEADGISRALATAMKNLKPGETIETLLAQLAKIPDQAERTQKAVELFGTIAGPKMALAIKPGRESLDDFILTEDQFMGKTQQAADVIDESFGNRAKMVFKGFQVTLAELGLSMDSALIAFALFGPKLGTVLAASLTGMVTTFLVPRLLGALTTMWLTAGGANVIIGAASASGLSAGTAYSTGFLSAIGTKLIPGIAIAFAMKGPMEAAEAEAFSNSARYRDFVDDAKNAGTEAGVAMGASVLDSYVSVITESPEPALAGKAMGASVLDGYRSSSGALIEAAKQTVDQVRQAIVDGKAALVTAWAGALDERNAAANAKDTIIINNAEIAAAKKVLIDKGATDAEQAEARIRIRNLQASNLELEVELSTHGTRAEQIVKTGALLASAALDKGLRDKDPEIRQHWIDVRNTLQLQLANLDEQGYAYGVGFTRGFVRGLVADTDSVRDAARVLSGAVTPGGVAQPRAAGGPVTAGLPYIVGERRAELFVPQTNGTIIPSLTSIGGLTVGEINISGATGDPKVMVREFMAELQRERLRQGMSFGA